jgi:hypothetical protein
MFFRTLFMKASDTLGTNSLNNALCSRASGDTDQFDFMCVPQPETHMSGGEPIPTQAIVLRRNITAII